MKTDIYKLTDDQQKFIDATDFDLNNEVMEEQVFPEDLSFSKFYDSYQEKHLKKYGNYLIPKK
jgi:hypothetical protein